MKCGILREVHMASYVDLKNMGGSQNYGTFLGPYDNTAPTI